MTGFKSGASDDDPLGDDNEEDKDSTEVITETTEVQDVSGETTTETDGLPWIYQRNGITDGREKTVQLHLQQSTIDGERDLKSTLEGRFGESVDKADIREASYLVAMNHVDEVADQLREWGYDA